MKKILQYAFLSILASVTLFACTGKDAAVVPDLISLPNAFQPEGIAARGDFIYVGSIPSGAVYRADINTGTGSVLVQSRTGRAAIGLKVDNRGRIFVAGGNTGKAFVYDATTGEDLAAYTLTQLSPTFINDVVLTADAAWFTDSRNPVLYRLPLPADGSLAGQDAVVTLALTGDLLVQAGATNLNGIASAGQQLIAVQSNTGTLFIIDPATGFARKIDLGAETVVNGDGILLEGQTLFVVQNRLNQVAVIDLAPDFTTGVVRTRTTNPAFDIPTTVAAAGGSLYAVNARFGIQVAPDTTYNVVRFSRP